MSYLNWGLLGPDTVISTRRTRTLGLGSAVRFFNEQAVPGVAGIWYGKQFLYPLLGIAMATKFRQEGIKVTNINCANAVEALACLLAFEQNKWKSDSRLRGITKLSGTTDLSFKAVSKPGFYVTQPMRMASVRALPALGLVQYDANRFNQYELSENCLKKFKFAIESHGIYGKELFNNIISWTQNNNNIGHSLKKHLAEALSPLAPMDDSYIKIIKEVLNAGGRNALEAKRRRNALAWVESLRRDPRQILSWEKRPIMIDEEHWHDLMSGAAFFNAQEKSMRVLDAIEAYLYKSSNKNIGSFDLSASEVPESVKTKISELRSASKKFLDLNHTEKISHQFCSECASLDDKQVLRHLVARDNRVIRLVGSRISRGSEFTYAVEDEIDNDTVEVKSSDIDLNNQPISWPENISGRMVNLFLLNADLNHDLNQWIDIFPKNEIEQ